MDKIYQSTVLELNANIHAEPLAVLPCYKVCKDFGNLSEILKFGAVKFICKVNFGMKVCHAEVCCLRNKSYHVVSIYVKSMTLIFVPSC